MRFAGWGLGLTALWVGVAWLAWGRGAVPAVGALGLLATAIQVLAVRWLRPAVGAQFAILLQRWGMGVGLRLAGLVAFAALVALDRERFPPVPSALGYVGVLLPLLFMETRLLR